MLQLDDLAALDAPSLEARGQPLLIPVENIDEDPNQPRREFDAVALQELAETIRSRGVRQPVSVRPDSCKAGRWVLNFGARRLRACRLAGLKEIPAFVDTTADSYDQMIENEQREGLRPLELSLFVQNRLALGDSQSDIARQLGKSRQWVTLATALIEAPDWLLQAYREGRCRGMNELYALRRLHGEHAQAVEGWAAQQGAITRERIAVLRDELDRVARRSSQDVANGTVPAEAVDSITALPATRAISPHVADAIVVHATRADARADRLSPTDSRLHVELDGQDYQLVVSVTPDQAGHVYVRPLMGGPRRLVLASTVKLLGFVGRQGVGQSD